MEKKMEHEMEIGIVEHAEGQGENTCNSPTPFFAQPRQSYWLLSWSCSAGSWRSESAFRALQSFKAI